MTEKNSVPLAIITEEFRPSKKGGIATWSYELVKQFCQFPEYRLTVFVKKRGGCDDLKFHQGAPYTLVPMGGRDWSRFKKWYVTYYLRKYLKKFSQPIILAATWELAEGIVGIMHKYPHFMITAGHGLEITRLNWSKYHRRIPNFLSTLEKSVGVVTVSHYTKNEIRSLGYSVGEKIKVIPNGVDELKYFPTNKNLQWGYFHLEPNARILLTLARLTHRKGQDIVIKALPEILSVIPDLKYVIAGAGNQGWETYLRKLVHELDLEKQVIFLGYVSEQEKIWLYQLSTVYIMLSKQAGKKGDSEGFGISYLEANACGLPVIGSRTGGIPEALEENVSGLLVATDDVEATVAAVIELFRNQSLYQRLAESGRERVLRKYTWAIIASEYQKLFQSFVVK